MTTTPPTRTDTPQSAALDLAYVISNAARVEGHRLSPETCKRIAAAITARPGLIAALARPPDDGTDPDALMRDGW